MGHDPTVRADFAEVRVSVVDAAVTVQCLPPCEAMGRVCKRSAEEVAFWTAMLAAPEDDLPRLVYADWLDERGDPAGGILRGTTPVVLHAWGAVGDRWEHRNQLRADWGIVLTHMRVVVAQAGHRVVEWRPAAGQPALCRYAPRPRPDGTGDDGAWEGLSATTEA